MSEAVTAENAVGHIQKLYNYVGILARNHNKIVEHLTDIHKNVKALHENVKSLKATITPPSSTPSSPSSSQPSSPGIIKK